ncbi:hypothetical protein [Frigoriglobus tundricola]|uniref:Uncharacterized protein n=1 Tax=Frigoriglobus tundricola TaxID=2774151 RepID=A0A6M5YL40_9BACT|nr:hypothetical protein [Frigoriglobus tundricola]QJW94698.1 hypothetical protein FTUN_2220 [Frigoriglobus tundricola]
MTWKETTALVIIAAFLILVGYDLIAYARGGNPATLSRVSLDTANTYRGFVMVVCLAVGVLLGHLFVPQHE